MFSFIVNPNAGGEQGYRIWKKLERRLIRQKAEYQVFLTGQRGEAREIASDLTRPEEEDPGTLIAVGGDGVMNEVADGVHMSTDPVLGYIPAGRRSDLARGLCLPRKPSKTLKKLLQAGQVKLLDYGVVEYGDNEPCHRRFLVNCGVGFDAAVTEERRRFTRRHFTGIPVLSKFELFLLSCRCLFETRMTRGYLILDGSRRVELNNLFLLSAQLQPTEGGGLKLTAPGTRQEGCFNLCVLQSRSRLHLFSLLLKASFRTLEGSKGVRSFSCREFRLVLEEPVPMHTDGESCGSHRELRLRCVRQKMKIVC